jgi:hypothetical protein
LEGVEIAMSKQARFLRFTLSAAMLVGGLAIEASTVAQFAPSGGALLHSEEAATPPPVEVVTEPPADTEADTEEEQVKHDIAGFDKANFNGFFVQSRDEQFRLNIGAYAQFRYNLVWRETPPAGDRKFDSGFVVSRTRFFFEGKMTDRIEYQLRFNIDDTGAFSLLIAYAGYNFKNYHHRSANNGGAWNLRVGRQFIAITREDWMFAQDILTTEFSAVDQAFAVGTADGLQAFYGRDKGRVWFALSNGAAGGKEDFPNNTTSQALLSARGEVQLLGDDWGVFNDLVGRKGRSLGVLLGVGSAYAVTGPNAAVATPRHQGQVTVDLSVGGDGFQVMAYGMWNWQAVGTAQSTWGFVAQAGYFILEPWQVYAQYSLVHPGKLAGLVPFNALTLGTSLFPFDWTNRIKLSLEGALLFNAINSTLINSNPQNGWLPADGGNQYSLRAQLQFGF